jgi:hypothetical protein
VKVIRLRKYKGVVKINIEFSAKTTEGITLINEGHKEYLLKALHVVAEQLGEGLNLSTLKTIIIPENFKTDLFEFQKSVGLPQECTDNENAQAVAKVLTYIENEEKVNTIFFSKALVFTLFDENSLSELKKEMDEESFKEIVVIRQTAINLLHHELSHVHEGNLSESIVWKKDLNKHGVKLLEQLRYRAMNLWHEYYACRNSALTHYLREVDTVYIIELCKKIETEILDKRKEYNLRIVNLNEFVTMFHENINTLLIYSVYAHGNYFSLNSEDRQRISNEIFESLSGTLFKEIWQDLGVELDKLFFLYPSWDTIDVLDNLCKVILCYIESFDIYLQDVPNGLYYNIPVSEDLL